jgi:hypothetical protein
MSHVVCRSYGRKSWSKRMTGVMNLSMKSNIGNRTLIRVRTLI